MKTHRIGLERATTPVIKRKVSDLARTDEARLSEKLGSTTALKQIFESRKTQPGAVRPHQIVEVDYVVLDIFVVDNTRKVHGRSYLTVGVCPATRKIVGWHVGLEKPNWPAMVQAFRASAQRRSLTERETKSVHLGWRVPKQIIVDNGSSFHSRCLVTASEQFKFKLLRPPVPRLSSTVERFFNQLARGLKESRRSGTDKAVMTIEQAQQLMRNWVADCNNSSKLATRTEWDSHGDGQP